MGKIHIKGGSPLKLRFEDDAGKPIESVEINGTEVQGVGAHRWFKTNIQVARRPYQGVNLPYFRVSSIKALETTLEFHD